jgi:glycosyltransferase involved in cell wall biosynthesis
MNKLTPTLVSIIIPCYNYGAYVSDAINSILAQTYKNWELIVINDGSTDSTKEVVMPYVEADSRIRYYYQPNKGLSAARNAGLALTKGEYIQLLDADDCLAPEKLRLQVEILDKNQDIDLVYSDAYIFHHGQSVLDVSSFKLFLFSVTPVSGQGVPVLLHMAADNMFLPGAPLYRRSMEEAVKGFKEDLYPIEDWHYWYRGLLQNKNYLHDNRREAALHSRHHGNNMSINRYRMWRNRVIGREDMLPIIKAEMSSLGKADELLHSVLDKNRSLLKQEKARYNLLYGGVLSGIYNMLLAAVDSRAVFATLYEGAYLLKERALGHNLKR